MVWWLIVAKQVVFRVLAACLAFVPAMLFGVAAVNKYYDYYQNWNSAIADITSQAAPAAAQHPAHPQSPQNLSSFLGQSIDVQAAEQGGYTLHRWVAGKRSGITRSVYVYLPPQYFAPWASQHLPLPGDRAAPWLPRPAPGLDLRAGHHHDARETGERGPGRFYSCWSCRTPTAAGESRCKCLNQVHGPQDATYLAQDLPADISPQALRVQPPGRAWGIAGYS